MRLLPLALLAVLVCVLVGAEEEDLDFYELLGIGRDASEKQIKKAYRKMSVRYCSPCLSSSLLSYPLFTILYSA